MEIRRDDKLKINKTKKYHLPDPESDTAGVTGVLCLLPLPLRDFFVDDIALRA